MTLSAVEEWVEAGAIVGGRYHLEELVGRGGMGRVFRARDVATGRMVAVKVLHRAAGDEPDRAERFKREIGILARIKHPAVPAVLTWGEVDGSLYFASEFIDGVDLTTETARRGRWPAADAATLAAAVADALAAAHALGIVHRDVNSNNIMIPRAGGVRLLDFGIARAGGVDITRITSTGIILGTPVYMAPEQFESRPVDARSDIYSLGVVLFEMLTGRPPFSGQTAMAIALQHKGDPAPSVRSLCPDVPAWLDRIVLRCLEKNPAQRFDSAAIVARELVRPRSHAGPRGRRLASGDLLIEDAGEHSDWALVLMAVGQKTGWSPGMALRFEGRFYQLVTLESPQEAQSRWTYRFAHWPEGDIFRHVVDYEQDCAARTAATAATLRRRVSRWFRRRD